MGVAGQGLHVRLLNIGGLLLSFRFSRFRVTAFVTALEWMMAPSAGLVQQQGLANVLDLGNGALEIECFCEDYLEDLHGAC
jgi:hypothetical protein